MIAEIIIALYLNRATSTISVPHKYTRPKSL